MLLRRDVCTGRIESSPEGPGGFCEDDMAGRETGGRCVGVEEGVATGVSSYVMCIMVVIGVCCIYRRGRAVLLCQTIVACGALFVLVLLESDDAGNGKAHQRALRPSGHSVNIPQIFNNIDSSKTAKRH